MDKLTALIADRNDHAEHCAMGLWSHGKGVCPTGRALDEAIKAEAFRQGGR